MTLNMIRIPTIPTLLVCFLTGWSLWSQSNHVHAFSLSFPRARMHPHRLVTQLTTHYRNKSTKNILGALPGADIEQPPIDESSLSTIESSTASTDSNESTGGSSSSATASIQMPSKGKGKVNEIDFCIAPADASISRAYGTLATSTMIEADENGVVAPILSLTRALNNASNRAVRRILLSRSWPSAEALNLSLRQVAEAERQMQQQQQQSNRDTESSVSSIPKCPVPRPILNVLTRKRETDTRPRTDQEYVVDQLKAFAERYGSLPGYSYAEAYLESILSLATSGVESPRATEVLEAGVYDDAYRRIKAVLRTVGVTFVKDDQTGRPVIAKKLFDQDICWSMLDKIGMRNERDQERNGVADADATATSETTVAPNTTPSNISKATPLDEKITEDEAKEVVANENEDEDGAGFEVDEDGAEVLIPKLNFWRKKKRNNDKAVKEAEKAKAQTNDTSQDQQESNQKNKKKEEKEESSLKEEDLGGVLLSAEEPTMTRQLNVLSNIVQRALLFGGDQELLVLSETLDADRAAFADRWYGGTGGLVPYQEETRPGIQYLNCLIALLRNCYNDGIVINLQPPLPLLQSYANAYERLVATSVELGSGYLKPDIGDILTMPTPRTATEELGRFAVWETTFRQQKAIEEAHPSDLQGTWEVRDEIGGETIGISKVEWCSDGTVELAPPLEGLRWRCDPGPTHLDTCTFQVLSSDGTILQYRGFIDRGSRLEARVSKRPIQIRGNVMFQMRDGSIDYFKDMLPINYRQGTTKFVMTKQIIQDQER